MLSNAGAYPMQTADCVVRDYNGCSHARDQQHSTLFAFRLRLTS